MTQEKILARAIFNGLKEATKGHPRPVNSELLELLARGVVTFLLDLCVFCRIPEDRSKMIVRRFGEGIMNAEININENKQQNDRRRN